jgi:hypothetical protein
MGDFTALIMRFLDIGADLISKFLSVAQNIIISGILAFCTYKYGLSNFNRTLLYALYAYLTFQIIRTLFDLVGHALLDGFEARILHEDPLLRRMSERILFPPFSRHTFNTYADAQIQAIYVCREPIQKYWRSLESGANACLRLLLGDLIEKQQEPIFHTSLLIVVGTNSSKKSERRIGTGDGPSRLLKLDRSEIIKLTDNFTVHSTYEIRQVELPKRKHTLRGLLRRLQRSMPFDKLVKYDINENNCQTFIIDLLQCNRLLEPTIRDFVSQDVRSLLKSIAPLAESGSQIYAAVARIATYIFER